MASGIGVEYLTLALPTPNAHLIELRRRFPICTLRRLYRVIWPGPKRCESSEARSFLLDVALW